MMRVEIESNGGTCAHYFKMQAMGKSQTGEINRVAGYHGTIPSTPPPPVVWATSYSPRTIWRVIQTLCSHRGVS